MDWICNQILLPCPWGSNFWRFYLKILVHSKISQNNFDICLEISRESVWLILFVNIYYLKFRKEQVTWCKDIGPSYPPRFKNLRNLITSFSILLYISLVPKYCGCYLWNVKMLSLNVKTSLGIIEMFTILNLPINEDNLSPFIWVLLNIFCKICNF